MNEREVADLLYEAIEYRNNGNVSDTIVELSEIEKLLRERNKSIADALESIRDDTAYKEGYCRECGEEIKPFTMFDDEKLEYFGYSCKQDIVRKCCPNCGFIED